MIASNTFNYDNDFVNGINPSWKSPRIASPSGSPFRNGRRPAIYVATDFKRRIVGVFTKEEAQEFFCQTFCNINQKMNGKGRIKTFYLIYTLNTYTADSANCFNLFNYYKQLTTQSHEPQN